MRFDPRTTLAAIEAATQQAGPRLPPYSPEDAQQGGPILPDQVARNDHNVATGFQDMGHPITPFGTFAPNASLSLASRLNGVQGLGAEQAQLDQMAAPFLQAFGGGKPGAFFGRATTGTPSPNAPLGPQPPRPPDQLDDLIEASREILRKRMALVEEMSQPAPDLPVRGQQPASEQAIAAAAAGLARALGARPQFVDPALGAFNQTRQAQLDTQHQQALGQYQLDQQNRMRGLQGQDTVLQMQAGQLSSEIGRLQSGYQSDVEAYNEGLERQHEIDLADRKHEQQLEQDFAKSPMGQFQNMVAQGMPAEQSLKFAFSEALARMGNMEANQRRAYAQAEAAMAGAVLDRTRAELAPYDSETDRIAAEALSRYRQGMLSVAQGNQNWEQLLDVAGMMGGGSSAGSVDAYQNELVSERREIEASERQATANLNHLLERIDARRLIEVINRDADLNEQYARLLDGANHTPASIDFLIERSGLPGLAKSVVKNVAKRSFERLDQAATRMAEIESELDFLKDYSGDVLPPGFNRASSPQGAGAIKQNSQAAQAAAMIRERHNAAGFNGKLTGDLDAGRRITGVVQQAARDLGMNIRISSGYRTDAENRRVGGSPKSRHRGGLAMDIAVINDVPMRYGDPEAMALASILIGYLETMGWQVTGGESGVPKAIMWGDPGHRDHIHISWK